MTDKLYPSVVDRRHEVLCFYTAAVRKVMNTCAIFKYSLHCTGVTEVGGSNPIQA